MTYKVSSIFQEFLLGQHAIDAINDSGFSECNVVIGHESDIYNAFEISASKAQCFGF